MSRQPQGQLGHCYAPPPYEYTKAEEIIVVFETDSDSIGRLLPQPLKPSEKTFASLRVMRHALGVFGPYTGVYLGVTALLDDETVVHILSGIKTDFAGTAAGRELWGLPLQLGTVAMNWHGEILRIDAGRSSDLPLASIQLQLTKTIEPRGANLRSTASAPVPNFEQPSGAHALVGLRTDHSYEGAEMWAAEAAFQLHEGTPRDNWALVPVGPVIRATYMTGGRSVLHAGEVLTRWTEET